MSKYLRKLFLPAIAISSLTYASAASADAQQKTRDDNLIKFKKRADHVKQMQTNPDYDIVIIGGGCNGAGVLLDASTRGFRTLLIQQDDFASGASSKSTKLIHGGVRYLQQVFELSKDSFSSRIQKFNLVKQAIVERSIMIDSAEHLTKKIPFVIPCENALRSTFYYIGSVFYYCIYALYGPKSKTMFNFPYFVHREDLLEIFPKISPKYVSGVVYEDGSFNDARLLLTAIITATIGNGGSMPSQFKPANAINRAQFIDFIKDGSGVIVGVLFKDKISGKQHKVNAKYVVNCTGVWSDKIRAKDKPNSSKKICIVGGSHLTYDIKIANPKFGLCLPSSDGRIILVVPWMNKVIAGTTEKTYQQPQNNPKCSEQQRRFIQKSIGETMSQLTADQIIDFEKARWCGLRPLVFKDASQSTKDISRTHIIERSQSGLYSLMGGKWTIYRKMGQDLVDQISKEQQKKNIIRPKSQTKYIQLFGAAGQSIKRSLIKKCGNFVGTHLYDNYGWAGDAISEGDLTPIVGPITRAELQWIVKNQLASEVEDVIMRRTRALFLYSKAQALKLVPVVAQIFADQNKLSRAAKEKLIKESCEKILTYDFD